MSSQGRSAGSWHAEPIREAGQQARMGGPTDEALAIIDNLGLCEPRRQDCVIAADVDWPHPTFHSNSGPLAVDRQVLLTQHMQVPVRHDGVDSDADLRHQLAETVDLAGSVRYVG